MEKIKTSSLIALIPVLAILTVYTYFLRYRDAELPPLPNLVMIPAQIGEYSSTTFRLGASSLKVLGADTTLARAYTAPGGETIEFFMGFFRTQQKNSQIHSPKHCYPGSGWDIIREKGIMLGRGKGSLHARSILISDGTDKRLVVYWFYINGKTVTDEFSLKWEQMKLALAARPRAAAFIRFSVILPPEGEEKARATMEEFIIRIKPDIDLSLERIFEAGQEG